MIAQGDAFAGKRCRVVILGGGFGGLAAAKQLGHPAFEVTVVDRQNHHLFQPLLYQVATCGLSASEISQPIRSILARQQNARVIMAEALGVDLAARTVRIESGELLYDRLIIALGSRTGYFGHPEWEAHAPGLKTAADALAIRNRVLQAFEDAEATEDPATLQRLLTVAIVGGGPTGVELAGAFAELTRTVLRRDFRNIDPRKARIVLIEAAPRILAHLSENLSGKALGQLQSLGVEVLTGTQVGEISPAGARLSTGELISASAIIWAAGVQASPLAKSLGIPLDRGGRVGVCPDLSLPGHPEVFVIGDMAAVVRPGRSDLVPGVAPAAAQMGAFVGRLLGEELRQRKAARPVFRYFDKGTMSTIGRSRAVAQLGSIEFGGTPAWLAWLLVHLVFLMGFRNKLAVFIQWVYSYFTYKRGARLIISRPGQIMGS